MTQPIRHVSAAIISVIVTPEGINSEQDVERLATLVVEGFAGQDEQPRTDLVIHNLTQDDKETAISLSTAKEGKGMPVRVEVCDGRRVGDMANRGG